MTKIYRLILYYVIVKGVLIYTLAYNIYHEFKRVFDKVVCLHKPEDVHT